MVENKRLARPRVLPKPAPSRYIVRMRRLKVVPPGWTRAILVAGATCAAGATPCAALTWAEARNAAVRNAPDLQVAARKTEVARAEVNAAGALANPTFTVTTARHTARLSTGVSVPMPLFGQRGLAIGAAEADANAVQSETQVTENDLRWNATQAWIDAWEASERARLVAIAAADAERLLTITEARFDAGTSPRLDVVRATADRARARADAEATAPLVAAAAARLAVWVGADPATPPAIAGDPGVPAALPSMELLLASIAHHPALARDRAQMQAANSRLTLERRLRFPIVSAELMVNQGDPTLNDANGNPQTDVIAGAAFELPLLSQRHGAIARAEGQRSLADATTALDSAHLRADLIDAFHRTQAGAGRARAIGRQALPAMEEARAMTEESYRSGRADLVRVLEAQRAVLDLRLAEREAIAVWSRSFADLERAVGQALDRGGLGE
jgi:cobalt-zinc-cadmium efflux system outer membrane protein